VTVKIAILGWGSLLWDPRPNFDLHHGPWQPNGPTLPIEFSRISKTRNGALTLVIDHQFGEPCVTQFSISARRNPDDAICDLRCREGTTPANVGYYFADQTRRQARSEATLAAVGPWARKESIDVVVWTDLGSNFQEKSSAKEAFSVANAIVHLQLLPSEWKAGAAEYIRHSPVLVDTPLRRAVQTEPWFQVAS